MLVIESYLYKIKLSVNIQYDNTIAVIDTIRTFSKSLENVL